MPVFPTTRRSVVLSLASGDVTERTRAFDTLVALYWKPLYKFARLAWNRTPEDCEDLTQSFFTRLLQGGTLASYDAQKAAFRTFLRMLFERHAANETKTDQRLKRGGGQVRLEVESAEAEMASEQASTSPEEIYQKEWVRSVFGLAIARLRDEIASTDFAIFEAYDLDGDRAVSYRLLAERFALTETTVTNRLAASRRKFREIVLDTLREATASDAEFHNEARALLGVEA
jgi:RNA polymerase sigma factor (sigma-70 family)